MKIPGYTIRRRLGSGGQALVYLAIQESLGRQVALKVLHPVHSESPEFSARFLNEARILANLGHSNVITIHDIGVDGELHYLSMELVEGGDLKQRIGNGMDVTTTLDYLIIIADCLATAHHKHIVHRDIKPANVLFRRDGTLLLTDFGIAKQLDSEGDLTVSGATMGSPNYLSPEQAQGKPLDGRADIYSLGAMAYEMLTGRKPYGGSSEIDTIFKHINSPVPELPAELAHLQHLIDRTMAKSPSDRFNSALDLRDYLRTLRNVGGSTYDDDAQAAAEPGADIRLREQTTEVCLKAPSPPLARIITRAPRRRSISLFALATLLFVAAWVSFQQSTVGSRDDGVDAGLAMPLAPIPELDSAALIPSTPAVIEAPPPALTVTATPSPLQRPAEPAPERQAGTETGTVDTVTPSMAASERAAQDKARTSRRIAALLRRAASAMADQRLTIPENDNAFLYYQQALELAPGNAQARDGLASIAQRYASMAQLALGRSSFSTATNYVRRGLAVDANNQELQALQVHLAQVDKKAASPSPRPRPPPARRQTTASAEIRGETPQQLLNRIKGWFN